MKGVLSVSSALHVHQEHLIFISPDVSHLLL